MKPQLNNKQLNIHFNTGKKLDIETVGNTYIRMNGKNYSYATEEARDQDFEAMRKYINKLKNIMFS